LAKAYGIESVVVEAPYGHAVPINEMKKHLETSGAFRAVFLQATESSTGVRNDIEALGKIASALRNAVWWWTPSPGSGQRNFIPMSGESTS